MMYKHEPILQKNMAQSDTSWKDGTGEKIDDDGVRIRGQHMMRQDGPDDEMKHPHPGLWIGHSGGTAQHFLEIQEFGDDSMYPNWVDIEREEIPKLVEALVERAYDRDGDQIRERVDQALEELEEQSDQELTYSEN